MREREEKERRYQDTRAEKRDRDRDRAREKEKMRAENQKNLRWSMDENSKEKVEEMSHLDALEGEFQRIGKILKSKKRRFSSPEKQGMKQTYMNTAHTPEDLRQAVDHYLGMTGPSR